MRAEDLVLKPQRCLEVLAVQLAKGEARAWAQAVEAREPFELSVWPQSGRRVADTYVPTDRVHGGVAVYRGIAGSLLAYSCDPTVQTVLFGLSHPLPRMRMHGSGARANCGSTTRRARRT